MSDTNPDIGDFQGVEINYATEYHEARKFMGTKGTDLDELFEKVILLMVNAPAKWVMPYQSLADEITRRASMLASLDIEKLLS